LNRQQRRNAKRPAEIERAIKAEEAKQKEREMRDKFRAVKMGQWFRDAFRQILTPKLFERVEKGDTKILEKYGYMHGIQAGNDMETDPTSPLGHKLVPTSTCFIVRRKLVKGKRTGDYETLKIKMRDKELVEREVESVFKFIWG